MAKEKQNVEPYWGEKLLESYALATDATAAERRMIMIKCKYEGTGIWSGRCVGTKEVDPCPGYDKCKEYKPDYMTNADRIRAMSDEELARLLCCNGWRMIEQKECLEWLQQPAE